MTSVTEHRDAARQDDAPKLPTLTDDGTGRDPYRWPPINGMVHPGRERSGDLCACGTCAGIPKASA